MISVLLTYKNASATLREAARSVIADAGPDDEVVLVDDGSTDCGPRIAGELAESDPRIVTLSTGGVGIARALGRGLEACRGEWIARMDADDVSLPGRFAEELSLLESDPRLAVAATQVALIGQPGPGIRRYVDWQNGVVTAAEHAAAMFVESPVCHPSTMIRRAALDAVGGFRDGPFAEDYDLWLRLHMAGWHIAKVPKPLFQWRMHGRNTTFTDPRLSIDALRLLRARYLAQRIERPFAVWGAGTEGRRLTRALAANGAHVAFFIDIDPRKIGRTMRGVPIMPVDEGLARARAERKLLVVAVAQPGARDIVRGRLAQRGFVEGTDFICAA